MLFENLRNFFRKADEVSEISIKNDLNKNRKNQKFLIKTFFFAFLKVKAPRTLF